MFRSCLGFCHAGQNVQTFISKRGHKRLEARLRIKYEVYAMLSQFLGSYFTEKRIIEIPISIIFTLKSLRLSLHCHIVT